MIYDITHRTHYAYSAPVVGSYARVHLLPSDQDGQRCLDRSVRTNPEADVYHEETDYFGNTTAFLSFHEPHTELDVVARSTIDTGGRPSGFPASGDEPWDAVVSRFAQGNDLPAREFSLDSPLVTRSQRLADLATESMRPGMAIADAVTILNNRINEDFAFDPTSTDVSTPLDEVLDGRRGVCQDFAHVLVGALRSVGLAACYVSGYLETEPPPGRPRLQGVDRTHAWVGVYLGDGQWTGVDPTNDQVAGSNYVTTARGRDYSDIPPLKGVIFSDSSETHLTVEVDVVPRDETSDWEF